MDQLKEDDLMPSITVSYSDLSGLLGRKIELGRLCERLGMLGIEAEASGDEVKLEVAHNRPDLLSTEGVARALKGFLRVEKGLPEYEMRPSDVSVDIDRSVEKVRPYIAAGVVEDVKLTDHVIASLMQVQEKLHASIGRKRRVASIGVYDMDTVAPPLRYTTVLPDGIKFVPLDFDRQMTPAEIIRDHPKGAEYGSIIRDLPRYPLLIDSKGAVLSMPPIINSEHTRVRESTRRLFIDVTGLEDGVVKKTLNVVMTGLAERGFKLRSVVMKYPKRRAITPSLRPKKFNLDVRRVNRVVGINVRAREAAKIAMAMRYGVAKVKGNFLTLLIPPYRTDIMHEIDIIEDMAVGYGYDNLEPTLPKVVTIGERDPVERLSEKGRRVMTGLGFTQVINCTLTNPRTNFELLRIDGEAAEVSNPVSEEYTIVRNSLVPSILLSLRSNRSNPLPQRVFEIGDVVLLDSQSETGARNVRRIAAAVVGEGLGFTYVRGVAEALLRELGRECEVRATQHASFIDGRVAELTLKGKKIGIVGDIHPEVILGFELEHPVTAFEVDLEI
jgi:phenylalanyl-tRNA synthetase beta chain